MGNKQLSNTFESLITFTQSKYSSNYEYLAAMAGKNSKKVNDKQKEEFAKDWTWKVVGASDSKCLQFEEKERRM